MKYSPYHATMAVRVENITLLYAFMLYDGRS